MSLDPGRSGTFVEHQDILASDPSRQILCHVESPELKAGFFLDEVLTFPQKGNSWQQEFDISTRLIASFWEFAAFFVMCDREAIHLQSSRLVYRRRRGDTICEFFE